MRVVLVPLMFLLLALSGCASDDGGDDGANGDAADPGGPSDGGDTGDSGGTGDNNTDPGDTDPPAKRAAVTWQVDVGDNSFSPSTLTIQAGDSVKFVYMGSNPHTATADNGEFDSGDCPGTTCFHSPVGVSEYTWDSATDDIGEVPYTCEVHSSMTGTITVQERYDGTP